MFFLKDFNLTGDQVGKCAVQIKPQMIGLKCFLFSTEFSFLYFELKLICQVMSGHLIDTDMLRVYFHCMKSLGTSDCH